MFSKRDPLLRTEDSMGSNKKTFSYHQHDSADGRTHPLTEMLVASKKKNQDYISTETFPHVKAIFSIPRVGLFPAAMVNGLSGYNETNSNIHNSNINNGAESPSTSSLVTVIPYSSASQSKAHSIQSRSTSTPPQQQQLSKQQQQSQQQQKMRGGSGSGMELTIPTVPTISQNTSNGFR